MADRYADFLREGFRIGDASEKANTLVDGLHHQLRFAAAQSRRKFLYDTNVGAGLPVIESKRLCCECG